MLPYIRSRFISLILIGLIIINTFYKVYFETHVYDDSTITFYLMINYSWYKFVWGIYKNIEEEYEKEINEKK